MNKALVFVLGLFLPLIGHCLLYPRESETREKKLLDGIWNFRVSPALDQDTGFREQWYSKPLKATGPTIPMPVPSSFNDVTQNRTIRDYIGWVWYDTEFFVPQRWSSKNYEIHLNFGSVHYHGMVYLNGISVVNHTVGHLPFQARVDHLLKWDQKNRLTVAVNNTLTPETIPTGQVNVRRDDRFPNGYQITFTPNFDFFNYAGIHRSVSLTAIPTQHIEDIAILTQVNQDKATVSYKITIGGSSAGGAPHSVQVIDADGRVVGSQTGVANGTIDLDHFNLWWPIFSHPNPGYLYTLRVALLNNDQKETDVYYQRFGIRTVRVNGTQLLINERPVYLHGVAKHEDYDFRGKGLDRVLLLKDFNLLKWMGTNSFRTSHYPYSEELMDLADEMGFIVIDECPAVGLNHFDDTLLGTHKQIINELIARDKNRPSVIMWSIANEPSSSKPEADHYFKQVADTVRALDPTRPVTAAINQDPRHDKASYHLDVIMVNRYYGWYDWAGNLDVITGFMVNDMDTWHNIHKKPIMISEYGADTVPGLHYNPSKVFTEDFQTELIQRYTLAYDILRNDPNPYFIGEQIWNFADFMTHEGITRVVGNKKGIFTRDRQPKASAKLLRCRYLSIANALDVDHDFEAYCPPKRLSALTRESLRTPRHYDL